MLLAALVLALSPSVAAHGPMIAVGEISARVPGADARTEQELRLLVSRELERLRFDRQETRDTYVFSASLVRFDAKTSRDGARAACVVSGILRKAASGAIVAMMQGRAAAEDERGALEGAKARALEGAVYGAVRHVPEAF
ncbi:MAG TPA: hypothetical protein VF395_17485 [Polyangiaceae bacterium]